MGCPSQSKCSFRQKFCKIIGWHIPLGSCPREIPDLPLLTHIHHKIIQQQEFIIRRRNRLMSFYVVFCSRHTHKRNLSGGVKKEDEARQQRSLLVDASTPLVKQSSTPSHNTTTHQSTGQTWTPPLTELS